MFLGEEKQQNAQQHNDQNNTARPKSTPFSGPIAGIIDFQFFRYHFTLLEDWGDARPPKRKEHRKTKQRSQSAARAKRSDGFCWTNETPQRSLGTNKLRARCNKTNVSSKQILS